MKGRMDVLNLTNQRSSKSTAFKDVIRIETDDEREKENCGVDLVINTRNKPMNIDLESVGVPMSDDDAEMDDEEEEDMVSDLPVLSVIIKEEDTVLNYSEDVPRSKSRPDIEIKYEDDIEEEDYDSEDSVNYREMPPLCGRPGVASPNGVPSNKHNPSFLSLDSSILNFEHDPNTEDSRRKAEFNGSVGRSGDSVLLSIVYATINVPFSQVSKFLTAYHLSKSQLSVIRKVRRQVKNRLYAQNCRRRRIAHIKNLSDELRQMKRDKEKMCNLRRDLLAKRDAIEKRYAMLYDHVMTTVRERCISVKVESLSDEEESIELYDQLKDESSELEEKKKRLEAEYHNLYTHIFKVISERTSDSDTNSSSCYTKTGVENPFNLQLRQMNIANEFAILNQYYSKNNKGISREPGDVDSSVSVDSSRTSENKMSDFVDYESGVSGDESRTEENTADDVVEYECSTNDGSTAAQAFGEKERIAETLSTATTFRTDGAHEIEDVILDETEVENVEATWCEDSEDEEMEADEEESGCPEFDEQVITKENLEVMKRNAEERFTKLYEYISKEARMDQMEFLKTFSDFCITSLLKKCQP